MPFWFSGSCFGSDWGAIEADPPAGFVLNDEGVYNLHSMRLAVLGTVRPAGRGAV